MAAVSDRAPLLDGASSYSDDEVASSDAALQGSSSASFSIDVPYVYNS